MILSRFCIHYVSRLSSIWKTQSGRKTGKGLSSSQFPGSVVPKNVLRHQIVVLISHANKVMLKILHARLRHYMSQELPDVQAGFRNGRKTRDQVTNNHWILEKVREFKKNIYLCFIDYAKAFDCVDHDKLWKALRDGNTRPSYLSPEKPACGSRSNS